MKTDRGAWKMDS